MGEAILIGNVSEFRSEMKIARECIIIIVTQFSLLLAMEIFLFKLFFF